MERQTQNQVRATSSGGNSMKSAFVLLSAACIWGMGFVAQRYGMDLVGPFFFAGTRTLLAALTILIVIAVTGVAAKAKGRQGASDVASRISGTGTSAKFLFKGGAICGVVLFLGQGLQQVGMVYTTASKAGFLTALYIVLVPIIGIFLKKRTHWNAWAGVALAAVGLYFLSITSEFTMLPGDIVLLVGAALWATHILVTGHYVPTLDQQGIYRLVTVQFAVCSALSFCVSPFIDVNLVPIPLTADILSQALPALLYSGCVSAGVGFTLQAIGQRRISPSAAGIILSLEAVFGAIGGAIILGERLSPRELLGCALMFAAFVLAQIPVKGTRERG
ncbi:MAG: DMT family transporter [Clostridiales Family XIII bacterium]|jgi:drug/metabolite transporter (DMT)-like permease|nr:DMT family transporter [Clostridiales Family XIII bacterium]